MTVKTFKGFLCEPVYILKHQSVWKFVVMPSLRSHVDRIFINSETQPGIESVEYLGVGFDGVDFPPSHLCKTFSKVIILETEHQPPFCKLTCFAVTIYYFVILAGLLKENFVILYSAVNWKPFIVCVTKPVSHQIM